MKSPKKKVSMSENPNGLSLLLMSWFEVELSLLPRLFSLRLSYLKPSSLSPPSPTFDCVRLILRCRLSRFLRLSWAPDALKPESDTDTGITPVHNQESV